MNALTPWLVGLAAGSFLLGLAVLGREAGISAWAWRKFCALSRLQQVLLVLVFGVMTVSAQKSGSNAVVNAEISEEGRRGEEGDALVERRSGETPLLRSGTTSASPSFSNLCVSPQPAVTTNDIAHGYAFVEARTNATVSYAMPTNGAVVGTWHLTGAYRDVVWVKLSVDQEERRSGVSPLPLWGDVCATSLWAYTWGKVRPRLRDKAHEIVAVGAPMSCVPGEGRLWTAATTNGSWLITWENFREGRLAKNISAQIEFFLNGDFITRANDVEHVYRRVNPDDWDDDGLANEVDDDPRVATDAPQFGPNQTLPDGANESAYCWVDLVVPQANAKVTFVGDGASNLADPSFIAKAGETNRVTLLIGKPYHVACAFPFEIVGQSSVSIEVNRPGDRAADICWPVKISVDGQNSSGAANAVALASEAAIVNASASASASTAVFSMTVDPVYLGGVFTWTNTCCLVSGSGCSFSYSCRGYCGCTGCLATGYYSYEGYKIACSGGGACGCSPSGEYDPGGPVPDDAPYAAGISLSFSKRAVIFEDRYERAPGVWVEKNSTATYLTGVVHGGPNGGTATFVFEGRDKLDGGDVQASVVVPVGQRYDFKIKYTGKAPSDSADDVVVRGTFTEAGGEGEPIESEATLTSVRVDITAVDSALDNPCSHRRKLGVHEWVECCHVPEDADFSLDVLNADAGLLNTNSTRFFCPWKGGTYVLRVMVRNVGYFSAIQVVEPQVVCRAVDWNDIGVIGCAGLLDMRLALYIEPTDVSFKDLYMQEIPEDEECPRDGYFATGSAEKTGELSHTIEAGAGVWGAVHSDASWMMDRVCRATSYPQPWSSGWKEWNIPVGWGDYLKNVRGRVSPNPTTQRFEIDADGTSLIRKYGHEIKRTVDNRVWLDGVLRN